MEKYTIYCTEEQTKKALELGAPIKFHYDTITTSSIPHFIEGRVGRKWILYFNPTAEQMIGFLHDYNPEKSITVTYDRGKWIYFIGDDECATKYDTRKEATLAAIDEVLNYLTED